MNVALEAVKFSTFQVMCTLCAKTDVMMKFVRSHLELEIWLMMKLFIWIPFVSDSRVIRYVVTS